MCSSDTRSRRAAQGAPLTQPSLADSITGFEAEAVGRALSEAIRDRAPCALLLRTGVTIVCSHIQHEDGAVAGRGTLLRPNDDLERAMDYARCSPQAEFNLTSRLEEVVAVARHTPEEDARFLESERERAAREAAYARWSEEDEQ